MRCKALLFLMSAAFVFSLHFNAFSADDAALPEISSSMAVLIETDRGQVIYGKDPERVFRSCLATVIMSAAVMIETQDKPSTVTITSILNELKSTAVDLSIGEKHSFSDLLHVMIMECAPELAVILADSIYENLDVFVAKMNEKASSLGLSNTYFALAGDITPAIVGNVSTSDLARLLIYCLRNITFKSVFTTRIFLWPLGDNENQIITNPNDLLWSMDNVIGGMKSVSGAGRKKTLVTAANINNLSLLCIVTDDLANILEADTDSLLAYASEKYRRGILAARGSPLTEMEVRGTKIQLSPNTDVYYTYPVGQAFVEKVIYTIPESVSLPVTRNVPVGTATYYLADDTVITVNLYPDKEILPESGMLRKLTDRLKEHRELLNIVLFLLIFEALMIIYRVTKKALSLIKKRDQ